jgi:hypothetical protein
VKLKVSILAIAALTIVLAGLGSQTVFAAKGDVAPVYWFEDTAPHADPVVPGAWSSLNRNSSGISAIFHTSGLEAGHVYTMWWVVFNHPEECIGGCDGADVGAALGGNGNPAGIGILYAAGRIAGGTGKLSIGARLNEGSIAGCQTSEPFDGVCTALSDPMGAEVHLVLHDHGPPIAGMVQDQLHSFDGGCELYIYGPDGTTFVDYGSENGTYACFSPQASPHLP